MRIACLHTAASNIAVFEKAALSLNRDDLHLSHAVRADLLEAAEAAGEVTPAIAAETVQALQTLSSEADAVLMTCSTLGPVMAQAQASRTVPMLRVDEAAAQEASRKGGAVIVLCATATTLEATRTLFETAGGGTGAVIDVKLVADAWELFKAGENDRYLGKIADAADKAFESGAQTVVLAQASMAGAAALCRSGKPLTSPATGLMAAIRAAESVSS